MKIILLKRFFLNVCLILAFCCVVSEQSFAAKTDIHMIVVQSRSLAPYKHVMEETIKALKEKGIKCRGAVYVLDEGNMPKDKVIQEIKDKNPDIILSIGSDSTVMLANHISGVPVIFSMVYRTDLLDKATEDKADFKGVFLNVKMERPFQFLKKIDPSLQRVGLIYSPSLFSVQVERIEQAAKKSGIDLVRKEITEPTDIPSAMKEVIEAADAVYLLPDPKTMTGAFMKKIMLATFKKRIFVFGESYEWVKKGALLGFAFDINEVIEKTAGQVEDCIRASGADGLHNLECEDYRLFINLKVADSLNIQLDGDLLKEARETGKIIR